MKILRIVFWAVPTYFAAWTLAYVAIMGTDFRYFFWYLNLAWTGRAREIPGFVQFIALGSVFLLGLFVVPANTLRKRVK